jgi:hypothetical protein
VALLKRIQCLQNSRLQRTQADGYGRGNVAFKKKSLGCHYWQAATQPLSPNLTEETVLFFGHGHSLAVKRACSDGERGFQSEVNRSQAIITVIHKCASELSKRKLHSAVDMVCKSIKRHITMPNNIEPNSSGWVVANDPCFL